MPLKDSDKQPKTLRKKKPGRPKKRRISEEHKRAISEANKAHWAKRKAAATQKGGFKQWLERIFQ